jgi:hypothetical protein
MFTRHADQSGFAGILDSVWSPSTSNPRARANVHFSSDYVPSYASGVRIPRTIRIDSGVYKRFKPNAKRIWGSVCNPVEAFMIAVNEMVDKKVYFSNTAQPIRIGRIVVERNLRPRRNLEFTENKPMEKKRSEPKCDFCGKVPVVGTFRHLSGIVKRACVDHQDQLRNHPKWSKTEDGARR